VAAQVTFSPTIQQAVRTLGQTDIVIGIPSYNNAHTIGHVVRAAQAGLIKYFPTSRGAIVNSDGGSKDGTPQQVLDAQLPELAVLQVDHPLYPVQRLTTPYHGLPGKGSAFRTIFQVAEALHAKACAVVDSDLRSIAPEWIEMLVRPALEKGFDFVAPYYLRHKYDGTITNSIVYPVTRALYGKRIRQPIGGDFGFSGRLLSHYLRYDVWQSDVARFGIDIWVTTTAICGGFSLCQAFLGAKLHDPKDPASDLSAMLAQVVGSLFAEMERHVEIWTKVNGSEDVPIFGFQFAVGTEPVNVNIKRMVDSFQRAHHDLRDIWSLALPEPAMLGLRDLATAADGRFSFSDVLWARIVYDFAVAYHRRVMDRGHLLHSLTPIYLAWVASFILQVQEAGPTEVEERLERLCLTYETEKTYLISRWQ
jgi:glycosyltransferase involved in cell wall biosynthesis